MIVNSVKYRTVEECLSVDPEVWEEHVKQFRAWALEGFRIALTSDRDEKAEHWRLMAHVVELDPRDWDGYGLLDRWEGEYEDEAGDCSSGCVYYRPIKGKLEMDWGVCTNPASHRKAKLTFEHQGCFCFEPSQDPELD